MNILFITADQWRGECLSARNHPHVKTPNLDKLAADGVLFKKHYAQAVPCGPSRACLLTGMYMQNNRSVLNGTPLDSRFTNIALEARKAGYEPTLFGYTDTTMDPRQLSPEDPVLKNYEEVLPGMWPVGVMNSNYKPWFARLKEKGYEIPEGKAKKIFTPDVDVTGAKGKSKTFAPTKFTAEDSNTAFMIDETINYLSVQQKDKWFVHLSFLSPHPPFIAPEPYNSQYDEADMPMPIRRETLEQEVEQHPWLKYYINHQEKNILTFDGEFCDNISYTDQDLRQIKATYYGMMSEVDNQIGRLIDYLKDTGTYDETLIVFTSDHGEQLGDHWMFSKYGYNDQTFYIPLIVRDPSIKANTTRGSVVDQFTESVDIMPSILDAIDLDIPHQCDGRSLLEFTRGDKPDNWRKEFHAEFDLRCAVNGEEETPPMGLSMKECTVNIISDERYKYVHFTSLPSLFFDLEKDPDEFVNLANDPDYQGLMLKYAQKMLSWRMEHDDPGLTDYQVTTNGLLRGFRAT